jgi:hypothetical protein
MGGGILNFRLNYQRFILFFLLLQSYNFFLVILLPR